ncbi:DUF4870 domain-containing protein [Lacinutrix gracilariae]|uniref:DUF4870 domain-containing protein n=1 Tax=Lacinutrix gracilariae TaxID=1747198 RepID=A0ABW5K1A0_9FLAO
MADNKNLSDDLEDMIGSAKEGAKKGAKKATEKAEEFAHEAKEAASDFAEDAKKVLSDGKNVAIIAHFTIIGLIIALVMNTTDKKTEYASFYIRQMVGLTISAIILGFIPVIGWIISLLFVVGWVLSLIGALSNEKKPLPVIGALFQDWFKSL